MPTRSRGLGDVYKRQVEAAVRGPEVDDPTEENAESSLTTESNAIDGAGLTPATKLRPPGLLELENLLADHLDTRVNVQLSARRGRLTIDFADLEDLERIYRRMTGE